MPSQTLEIIVRLRNLAKRGLKETQQGIKGIGATAKLAVASLARVNTALIAIGAAGLSVGALSALVRGAVRTFADFDDQMRAVGAVSGATEKQFKNLTAVAKEMGATTRFTASEAAQGLRFLAMAGFDADKAAKALPGTLNLAAAGALDLGTAADIATNILSGFALETEDLEQVNNVLVKTFSSSNTSLTELGESFKLVGPVARGLGGDFEDLFAAIGRLGDAGFKGSLAGTALRGALSRLFNPTKQQAEVMEELGQRIGQATINVRDAEGNFVGFVSIVEQLEKAGADGADLLRLFGQRAGPAMVNLVGIGSEALREYYEELRNTGNIAKETAEQMEAGLGGALRNLRSAWEAVKIAFGEAFAEELIKGIKDLRDWVLSLLDAIKQLKEDGTLQEWARNIRYTIDALIFAVKAALFVLTELTPGAKALTNAYKSYIGIRKELEKIQRGGVDAMEDENAVMDQNIAHLEKMAKLREEATAPIARGVGEGGEQLPPVEVPVEVDDGLLRAQIKSTATRIIAQEQTLATQMKQLFDQRSLTAQEYYDQRLALLNKTIDAEIAALRKLEEMEESPSKKLQLQDQIYVLEQKRIQDQIKLEEDLTSNVEKEEQRRLDIKRQYADLAARERQLAAADRGIGFGLQEELLALDQKHAEELARVEKFEEDKALIEETRRVQKLEKEKLLATQQEKLMKFVLDTSKTTLGGIAQGFKDAYDASGGKIKEFFAVYKAAAIAETIISTYQSAVEAFKALAGIPYVGPALGAVAAAAAIASGMARISAIRSQQLAEGGKVKGHSPTPTSDNIDAKLTAGEWVHPVSSVKYYGEGVMEAIRQKAIPRSLLSGFRMPDAFKPRAAVFQAGGGVRADLREARRDAEEPPIQITNIVDPNLQGEYLQSTQGQRHVINILRQNSNDAREALLAD